MAVRVTVGFGCGMKTPAALRFTGIWDDLLEVIYSVVITVVITVVWLAIVRICTNVRCVMW